MNKELIENFRWAAKEEKSPSNISYAFTPQQLEKFAELIIRDTLDVARAGVEFGPSMDEAVYTYFGLGNET